MQNTYVSCSALIEMNTWNAIKSNAIKFQEKLNVSAVLASVVKSEHDVAGVCLCNLNYAG